jgi:hypothetical protein
MGDKYPEYVGLSLKELQRKFADIASDRPRYRDKFWRMSFIHEEISLRYAAAKNPSKIRSCNYPKQAARFRSGAL